MVPGARVDDSMRMNSNRLTRSRSDKMVSGVAGGLGAHFGVDPVLFRIAFAVSTLFSGAGLVAYVVMMFAVPREDAEQPDVPLPA